MQTKRIKIIDSHTGGEPTRVVISGGPDLGRGSIAERLVRFKAAHDIFRSAVVNEPRGSDAMVHGHFLHLLGARETRYNQAGWTVAAPASRGSSLPSSDTDEPHAI